MQQNSVPKLAANDFEHMTQKWRNRSISNYDYLMYLNNQAHRSFNDLTQFCFLFIYLFYFYFSCYYLLFLIFYF